MDELSEEDKLTVERARKIQRFMSQPFAVAQVFTGIEGRLVPLKDVSCLSLSSSRAQLTVHQTVTAFEEILEGKHDHISESSFYSKSSGLSLRQTLADIFAVVGGIDDVKAKHEKALKDQGN